MRNARLEKEKAAALLMRERIRAEIGEDAEAILASIESETGFNEAVLALVEEAEELGNLAMLAKVRITEIKARKDRLERKAETIRSAVAAAMLEVGSPSIRGAIYTVSARIGAPQLRVLNEELLPDWAFRERVVRDPDKNLIKERAAEGHVPGATLTNGKPILIIRSL